METVRPPHSALPPDLVSLKLGIWRVILRRRNLTLRSASTGRRWRNCVASIAEAHVLRLFRDIATLGPFHFLVAILSVCLSGAEGAATVWSLDRLLRVVEDGYTTSTQDVSAILKALAIRLLLTTTITAWRWMAARTNAVLSTRVKMHFEERLLRAHLDMDLASSQKNSGNINISPMSAWDTFQSFLGTLRILSTAISQILLITSIISSQTRSLVPLFLCMIWPIITAMSERQSLWCHSFIAYVTSEPYRRLKALYNLAMDKTEVIGGGLARYVLEEYRKAQQSMGDTSSEQPWELYTLSDTPWHEISSRIFNDLPLIYYAIECMRRGAYLSTASLATLQQICYLLSDTVRLVIQEKDNIARNLRVLKDLYRDYGTPQDISKAAPPPVSGSGMDIELRNVTFQYPNSDGTTLALRNISFSIKPSSLVVIVGANGSGKSSLVNLLTGLHEPTSGEILMDGHSAQSYYKPDLQACIALLAQRHQLFNLSIAETIGIGDPDHANDRERIEQAARLGGAYDFVQRYNAGFDEIIQPVTTSYSSDYPADDQQLREVFDSIERQKDISGGERQRLAASRTFMRLMSGKIKLVVVDEPTSAMDPLGEFELFEKLRSQRSGKTMIFVTHRFGHLTKHADLILCMKDGQLVESGTHTDLVEQRGEYHRLYEIQACAFND